MNIATKMSKSIIKIKEMDLMKPKGLCMVEYKGNKDNNLNSNIHSRQTNPGYSRNKFGGFYTKWSLLHFIYQLSDNKICIVLSIMKKKLSILWF